MAWIALTDADVLDEITPAENAALKNIQGATEVLPRVVARVVAKFRGAIQSGGATLGPSGTLPDSVHDDAVAYARWRFLITLPQAKTLQTEERRLAYEEAVKMLEALRQREFSVEPDDDTGPASGGNWGSETKLTMRTHRPAP